MLPKKNRISTGEVEKIFKEGKFINSPNLTFRFILRGGITPTRISFIAPKNVAKKAVERNLLRRRGYTALANSIHDFPPGLLGVFVFKKPINPLETKNEIKTILNKIN